MDRPHRLIVTVHGIRTFGNWQERLTQLLHAADPKAKVINYKYGYFSIIAFLIPFVRWLVTRQFRLELQREIAANPGARIDIVAHSFGTHLAGWGLLGIPASARPRIHTIILAGSVLKPSFPWRDLLYADQVHRVINECGTCDGTLVVNQLFVPLSGMAGRLGFHGMMSDRFMNRFHAFGHSGYFLPSPPPQPDFMQAAWLPLLLTENPPQLIDKREATAFQGLLAVLLNNAEPIKIACYTLPFILLASLFHQLWRDAKEQTRRVDSARTELKNTNLDLTVANERAWQQLSETHRQAANYAMQRGAWKSALGHFGQTRPADDADGVLIRLDRVKCQMAGGELKLAAAEIESLAGETDLNGRFASIALWQGYLELEHSELGQSHHAVELIRQALAAKPPLPAAEAALAAALVADSWPAALQGFEEAVRLDPFDPRANQMSALTLMYAGRFDEAQERVRFAQNVFPDDAMHVVVEAHILALTDRLAAAEKILRSAKPLLDKSERYELSRQSVRSFHSISDAAVQLLRDHEHLDRVLDRPQFKKLLIGMLDALAGTNKSRGHGQASLPVPLPFALEKIAADFSDRFATSLFSGEWERISSLLLKALPNDGLAHYFQGIASWRMARWNEAETAYRKAREFPSLVNIKRPALCFAARAAGCQAKDGDANAKARTITLLHEIRKSGEVFPWECKGLVLCAGTVEEWNIARWIAAEWRRMSPDNLEALKQQAVIEEKSGAPGQALRFADKLAMAPAYRAEAEKIRTRVREQLLEQIRSLDGMK